VVTGTGSGTSVEISGSVIAAAISADLGRLR
jgi:hypothetical protein